VPESLGEEGLGLSLAFEGNVQGLAARHEGARLLVLGGLDVPEHRAVHAAGLVAEEGGAPLGQLLTVFLLVFDHGPEELRRLGRVLVLHLLGEFEIGVAGLFFDQDGQIQGVPQIELLKVERFHGFPFPFEDSRILSTPPGGARAR
jgi:hypothetical protein